MVTIKWRLYDAQYCTTLGLFNSNFCEICVLGRGMHSTECHSSVLCVTWVK